MYVRIARFEGGKELDKQLDEIRQQMAEGRERLASGAAQGEEAENMRAIKRTIVAVDREGGRTAAVMFADSEEDIRKIDAWMNSMSPGGGGGQRTSADIYEVAIDEQT
jgi:ribosomal protein L29